MTKATFKVWSSDEGPSDARQIEAHDAECAALSVFERDFDKYKLESNVEYTYWVQREGSEKAEQYECSRRVELKSCHVETRDVSEWEVSE